jgi:stage V sporulation protein SpoVS
MGELCLEGTTGAIDGHVGTIAHVCRSDAMTRRYLLPSTLDLALWPACAGLL